MKKSYLIEENTYNSDGSLSNRSSFKYDDKGNKIEVNLYNSDKSLNLTSVYKYNVEGDVIEENTYNVDGSINFKYFQKYIYSNNGNWLQVITYKDGIPVKMGNTRIYILLVGIIVQGESKSRA